MEELTADNFDLASCQATVFTPDGDLVVSKVMSDLYPLLRNCFDGDPTILPPLPEGAPPEIPRIILESKSHEWRCELSTVRVSIYWRRTKSTEECVALPKFFDKAANIILECNAQLQPRIARLAAVATRYATHADPGLFLARHFCKDRWEETPLNRPENFELHAHKRFTFADDFQVNSWARSKTGRLTGQGEEKLIVLFEQDLNTLAEEMTKNKITEEEVKKYFGGAAGELDHILQLYYPDPNSG